MKPLHLGGCWQWRTADYVGWFAWVWRGNWAWGGFGKTKDEAIESARAMANRDADAFNKPSWREPKGEI